jgi:hypothetical protein
MPPLFTDLPPFHAPPPRPRPACTPPRALWSPPLKRPSPRGLVGHDAVDYDGPVQMNYEFLNDLHAKLSNSKRVQLYMYQRGSQILRCGSCKASISNRSPVLAAITRP